VVIVPVIDGPTSDPDEVAAPLDDIALTVAHAGSERDLVTQTFLRGETIEVPSIPFGDDLVLHMSGFVGTSSVAYGRTCAFAVSPSIPPPSPHLFFSRSVKFASTNIMASTTGGVTNWVFRDTGLEETVPLAIVSPGFR